ncbi:FtsW/RodA/SpoVE family cell cycle protein, partial [Staphylococcus pseudintermedius]|uniref:FtsW/RodA/SpoVE family cell cycle protein n=1 Tax=Staphylococcus pseudintermedius TaxID=283734 RepID=UPI000E3767D5
VLLFHLFQIIGMTIQRLRIIWIPLPVISYGGSSLWSLMSGVGVLLSIHYRTPKKYNDEATTQKRTTS